MADDAQGMEQPSRLRTGFWAAAAAVAGFVAVTVGGPVTAVLGSAVGIYAAFKAWGSHNRNNEIEADNEAAAARGVSPRQLAAERAAAIEAMADESRGSGVSFAQNEAMRRGVGASAGRS